MLYTSQWIVLHDVCDAEFAYRIFGERLELDRIDLLPHFTDAVAFPVPDGISQVKMNRIAVDS